MKAIFRLVDPSKGFLFGIDLTDGYAVNEITDEKEKIKMFCLGFILFEIDLIWLME